jgi:hypothetical protein
VKLDRKTLIGASVTAACSWTSLSALAVWCLCYAEPAAPPSLAAPSPPPVGDYVCGIPQASPADDATARAIKAAPAPLPREPGVNGPADRYDLAEIEREPDAYYGQSVPNRVWQRAPLPPGKPRHEQLTAEVPAFRFVLANGKESVPIAVQAMPGRPVTFTALDQGRFANGKISITVPADEFGYARADFWVGAAGDYRILAGSPENQGPAEFTLQALAADELRRFESGEYVRSYLAKLAEKARQEKANVKSDPPPPGLRRRSEGSTTKDSAKNKI